MRKSIFRIIKLKVGLLLFSLAVLICPIARVTAASTSLIDIYTGIDIGADIDTEDTEVKSFLTRFHHNPTKEMSRPIIKRNFKGEILPNQYLTDKQKDILSTKRYAFRNNLLSNNRKSAYGEDDLAENLIYNRASMMRNIFDMDNANLTEAKLQVLPWSDNYWPMYKGGIAFRYADPKAEASVGFFRGILDFILNNDSKWKAYHKYVLKNPATNYINRGRIDLLSPAEKYDLLIGDESFTLTKHMWEEGRQYFSTARRVETWMGICHGWALASYMLPTPLHAITVNSVNNKYRITFYPSDIKALSSLFWANFSYDENIIGGRCALKNNDNQVKRDPISGRILNQQCFDTNPGTWHMSVVNQLGILNKSFVIDAVYDYEVWNQPMVSYKYIYFNPQTFEAYADAKSAVIPLQEYTKDKFSRFRSLKTKSVVGVKMTIVYSSESDPNHLDVNPNLGSLISVNYYYDLELDEKGAILGGEWYADSHPDFLWTTAVGVKPYTPLDMLISNRWNPITEALPANWAENARKAVNNKLPLGRIIHALIAASRGTENYFDD
ncbi:MAG: hypothetical protein HQK51_06365 [Oligoflexia bacterium]|nr:hypothetical protein [Oligoflexia bacterium]